MARCDRYAELDPHVVAGEMLNTTIRGARALVSLNAASSHRKVIRGCSGSVSVSLTPP